MKEASSTGILFLTYTSSPTSIISTFSEKILVLGNKGSVLYYGNVFVETSSVGTLDEGKDILYDTYFNPQKHYNSLDCIYHAVHPFLLVSL